MIREIGMSLMGFILAPFESHGFYSQNESFLIGPINKKEPTMG
jgi:hypothetical protein